MGSGLKDEERLKRENRSPRTDEVPDFPNCWVTSTETSNRTLAYRIDWIVFEKMISLYESRSCSL